MLQEPALRIGLAVAYQDHPCRALHPDLLDRIGRNTLAGIPVTNKQERSFDALIFHNGLRPDH
ncbi:MAG TPA: hypothetical protein VIP98_17800 [Microlunatus sp.]